MLTGPVASADFYLFGFGPAPPGDGGGVDGDADDEDGGDKREALGREEVLGEDLDRAQHGEEGVEEEDFGVGDR